MLEESGRSTNTSSVPYLDLSLAFEGDEPSWQLYQKPMSKHLYLKPTSAHPTSVFKGIVLGGVKRILRRCKHSKDAVSWIRKFEHDLVDRGYRPQFITCLVRNALCSVQRPKVVRSVRSVAFVKVAIHQKREGQ